MGSEQPHSEQLAGTTRSGELSLQRRMRDVARSPSLVVGLPLVFVLAIWAASGGLPYFEDANESYVMYVHAWTLVNGDPLSFSFLSALNLSPETHEPALIYLNNANFPRYVHALL